MTQAPQSPYERPQVPYELVYPDGKTLPFTMPAFYKGPEEVEKLLHAQLTEDGDTDKPYPVVRRPVVQSEQITSNIKKVSE